MANRFAHKGKPRNHQLIQRKIRETANFLVDQPQRVTSIKADKRFLQHKKHYKKEDKFQSHHD